MYYSISGKLIALDQDSAVIENNGIAYEMLIPFSTFQKLPETGSNVTLFTRLIVRENDMYLVAFLSLQDRRLYDSLVTVSGIGPKQGLRILSDLSAGQIRNAIVSGDSATLSRVKGIGAKTASRIVLELKDKMKQIPDSGAPPIKSEDEKKRVEVLMALRVLGYNDNESKQAIDSIFSQPETESLTVEEIIRRVLAGMAK